MKTIKQMEQELEKEFKKKGTWRLIHSDKTESLGNYNPISQAKLQQLKDCKKEFEEKLTHIFKEEDKIIQKAMNKVNYLMNSRNISQEKERKELVDFRNKCKEEFQ